MEEAAELPDISFFGLIVKGGTTATYRIENEPGLMEICHLTNCALCSTSTSTSPVYVKIKSPEVDGQFVLGALIPGKILSFTTDLLITPDTEFCHTGAPEDEVHLTGYRSIDAATLLMEDDDDEEEDEEDDDDDDFIDDGEDEEEDSDDDRSGRGGSSGGSDVADPADGSEPELDEQQLQRSLQTLARKAALRQGFGSEASDPEASDDDDGEGLADSDLEQKMIDVLEQAGDAEGDVSMDDGDEDAEAVGDEDNSADPSAKTAAIQKANQRKLQVQREKKLQKRQLQETAEKESDAPEEAPTKRSKQAPQSEMPSHPANVKAESREFAEKVYSHLKDHPEGVPLDSLNKFRPKTAEKIGKMLQKYAAWFTRERVKGDKGTGMMYLVSGKMATYGVERAEGQRSTEVSNAQTAALRSCCCGEQ